MPVFNRRLRSALLAGTALSLAAIAAPNVARAATDTYNATTNGVYNTGTNYDTGNAPTTPDTAIFGDAGAAHTTITFTTATNPLTTLSFTGSTAYTFNLTTGQSLNPSTSLTSSSTALQTFNLSGTGSMTIGSVTNSAAGGETFATTGSGAVTISGADSIGTSTQTFTGNAATIGGLFTSAGGTLNISGVTSGTSTLAVLSGSGTITLGANNLTVGTVGGAITNYSGAINGTGGLTYAGTGVLTLNGTTAYTGGTTINPNGTINDANSAIASASAITANGTIQFTNSGTSTYSGTLGGTGSVAVLGGTEILSGTNTFTGTTTIDNNATLSVGTGGNDLGNTIIFGANNGTLATTAAVTTADAVTLTGNGAINATAADTFSGAVTGAGSLTKTGAGVLTLSNAGNNYSGGTILTTGGITLGANNAAGAGALAVGSGTTFAMAGFNQSVTALTGSGAITSSGGALTENSGTYTGNATSTGSLTKISAGTSVLDGTNTFSQTNVSGGSLQVGDAATPGAILNGAVTVQTGATLLGHGTINGNVSSTGTVQPGGSIGTLTINGNYTQSSSSTLAIELNPTANSRLAVSGTASLAGGLVVIPDPGTYATGTQYTILTANGGVLGRFSTTNSGIDGLFYSTTYLANSVFLTTVNINTTGAQLFTPNENRIGGAIRAILPTATGRFASGLAGLYGTMQAEDPPPQIADAIGELRADAATITLANATSFQNFLVERMSQRQGLSTTHMANNGLPGTFDVAMNDSDQPLFGPSDGRQPMTNDGPDVWVHGYGDLSEVGGETGFAEYQARTAGIAAGADMKLGQGSLVGAAVAYEHTDYNLSGDTDEDNIDTYRVSVYGSSKLDPVPLTIDGAVGYAFNDYHNTSVLGLISGTDFGQTSRHDGDTLTAETGLSHAFSVPQNLTTGTLTLIPRVGVEYDNIQQNAYTTTGAPVTALDIHTNGSTLNALRSTIGGKADLDFKTSGGTIITPEIRASYLHDFMQTNVALTENFAGAPGAGFTISGLRPGKDAALVGTGVGVGFSHNISVDLSYDADVRQHELDHVVQAGVKYKW